MALHPFRDFIIDKVDKLSLRTRSNRMGNYSVDISEVLTLEAGESKIIYDERSPVYLFLLTFASNSDQARIIIRTMKSEGFSNRSVGEVFAHNDDVDTMPSRIENILTFGSVLWEPVGSVASGYKLIAKRPLMFPRGMEIEISNDDEEPIKVGVRAHGVDYDY